VKEEANEPAPAPQERGNWVPLLVGALVVIAAVVGLLLFSRHKATTGTESSAYAQNLKLSSIKLSAAENYMGGSVTYLDLNITNTGDKALLGADVHAEFKNMMGQIVQKETLPLRVLVENQLGGYPDQVDMSKAPILPGQTKTVRITVDHISDDWDQSYPEMQLVNLKLK